MKKVNDCTVHFIFVLQRVSLDDGEYTSSEDIDISEIRKQIQGLEIDLEVRYWRFGIFYCVTFVSLDRAGRACLTCTRAKEKSRFTYTANIYYKN